MRNKLLLVFLALGILALSPQLALGDKILVEDADSILDLTLNNASNAKVAIDSGQIAEENDTHFRLPPEPALYRILLGDEVIVVDADTVWNLTLDDATDVDHLVGEPGVFVTKYADTFSYFSLEDETAIGRLTGEPRVFVTKYADTFSYFSLEDETAIGRLTGEPGVFVTKYADVFVYYLLEDATTVQHLVGEPGVMVTRYADTFMYEVLEPPFITPSFDTRGGMYPSMPGTHSGTIKPTTNITVTTLYTYACPGTGGHSKSVELYENGALLASGMWNGYGSDWHNITLTTPVNLQLGHTYNYTIVTASYPQIIHAESKAVTGGTITCTGFEDANGREYENWIPAIKLY